VESRRNNQRVIIAGHHTLYSKGPDTKPLTHPYWFGRIKASNMHFPSYARMVSRLRALLAQNPDIYYVSGHVHALLYFLPPDHVHYIVSGAGSKNIKVSAKEIQKMPAPEGQEHLLWNNKGFFELDYSNQGVRLFLHFDDAEHTREIDPKDL
jgi:hypothetical protein